MSIAERLASLQRHLDALMPEDEDAPPSCHDPFHDRLDYRTIAAPLFSGITDLPPAPRCPTCDGPRRSGGPLVAGSADALRWHPERQ